MTFKLGLTGSIGMGKSTTARLFADRGCKIWDADAAVHRLYDQDGAAVQQIRELYPEAIVENTVDRSALRKLIAKDHKVLPEIEKIVHPLVRQDRHDFAKKSTSAITVFDIPLLFETGSETDMDAVACVTVSPQIQEERVMARKTMTREEFQAIVAKQLPNDQKCTRSDFVIVTNTLDHAAEQVDFVISQIAKQTKNA